jgi:hypothetical protein
MVNVVPDTLSVPQSGFIKRLWRGEISLPVTYWICGSIGGVILTIISTCLTYSLGFNATSLSRFDITFISSAWIILVYCYSVFILAAIWRSASNHSLKYPRSKIWSFLAKGAVCLSVLGLLKSGFEIITRTDESNVQAITNPTTSNNLIARDAMISGLNANLPKKIDSVTILNKIGLKGNTFVYDYILSAQLSDVNEFEQNMKASLIKNACSSAVADNLKAGLDAKYVYTDPNNAFGFNHHNQG